MTFRVDLHRSAPKAMEELLSFRQFCGRESGLNERPVELARTRGRRTAPESFDLLPLEGGPSPQNAGTPLDAVDAEIAAVANYVTGRFGSQPSHTTADKVAMHRLQR